MARSLEGEVPNARLGGVTASHPVTLVRVLRRERVYHMQGREHSLAKKNCEGSPTPKEEHNFGDWTTYAGLERLLEIKAKDTIGEESDHADRIV